MKRMSPVLPAPQDKTEAVRGMFDAIAPRYEFVNRMMTFGLDARWRKRTVSALGLAPGSTILDLACGTGDLSRTASAQGFDVVGVDLSFGMLDAAHGIRTLCQGDASSLPIKSASIDGILCGYALRNFTDLDGAMSEMARVLRPGGRIALLEVGAPKTPVIRIGYRYLPASTVYLPEAEEIRSSLVTRGFSGVNHHELSGGLSQLFTATRSV